MPSFFSLFSVDWFNSTATFVAALIVDFVFDWLNCDFNNIYKLFFFMFYVHIDIDILFMFHKST